MTMLSDAELLVLGKDIHQRYQGGFEIDGRPLTNIEMFALHAWNRHLREERIKEVGCCNDQGSFEDGMCRKSGGWCPLYREAEKILYKQRRDESDG